MNLKLIDIHTHLQFAVFDDERGDILDRSFAAGVGMINVGTQKDTSRLGVELAREVNEKHGTGAWATVGLHPIHTTKSRHDEDELGKGNKGFTSRGEEFDYNYYKELAQDPVVVGIGECGLDYFHLDEESETKQKEAFMQQIELANDVGKPLMLHVRSVKGAGGGRAYQEGYEMVREHLKVPGNKHFFSADWEMAKKYLDIGFTLSFTGVITFTNDYDEVVKNTPLDRIMIETDAPYITPVPYRGSRNEPAYVVETAKKIAQIRGLTFEEVAEATLANTKTVFKI